jgi:hypothetical protein
MTTDKSSESNHSAGDLHHPRDLPLLRVLCASAVNILI